MNQHSKHTGQSIAKLNHVFSELTKILYDKKIPFFQLRHKANDEDVLYGGDIDFFTSANYLDSILHESFNLAALNRISIIIDRKKFIKTKVIFVENNGRMITLEIWTCLEVKDPFRASLEFIFWEDFKKVCLDQINLPKELPLNVEALYYLSHLFTKKKKLKHGEVVKRITHYKNELQKQCLGDIFDLYENLTDQTIPSVAHRANRQLMDLGILRKRSFRSLFPEMKTKYVSRKNRLKTFFLRLLKFIPVVGPDGVGKTTTINRMALENKKIRYYRFKKLFRQSMIYKLALPIIKKKAAKRMNAGKLAKNQVDDHYGNFIFYISKFRYYVFILFNLLTGKIRFSDRYFHDFLFENLRFNHKTTELRSNWHNLLKKIPATYLMIQLNAPPEIITSRKKELTAEDITIYRDGIFSFYLKKPSVIYYCIDTSSNMDQNGGFYHFLARYF